MTDFDLPLQQEISFLSTFDVTRIVVAANVGFDGLRCGGARKGQKSASADHVLKGDDHSS